VACVIVPGPDGQPRKETRTFDTMTEDLEVLSSWLSECGVTPLCDYNSETTPANNLVLKVEEKNHVSRTEW
jgi:hypothetical protein